MLGCASYEFCYDWRRSCCESTVDPRLLDPGSLFLTIIPLAAVKFAAYLRWISAKHDGAKVQVVAHSMGGLISTVTMNLYPELFHSLLVAGTVAFSLLFS